MSEKLYTPAFPDDDVVGILNAGAEVRRKETLLKTGALQTAIFNSVNFSSIATDEKGVIQIFNVGAEHMLGYTAAEVVNTITPADISDPQEVIARAEALSTELSGAIEVRAVGDPGSVANAVREAVAEVAPSLPVTRTTMLAQQVDRSLNQERLISVLAAIFGGLALGLACFGLYGVMAYGVSRRVPEIGVRVALGATPGV